MRQLRLAGVLAALLLGALVVCSYSLGRGASQGASRGGDPTAGAAVFSSAGCGACHAFTPAGTTGKVGPSLDNLSLAAAAVETLIGSGRNGMPPFGGTLSAAQIANVTAYVLGSASPAKTSAPAAAKTTSVGLAVRFSGGALTVSPAVVKPGRTTLHVSNSGSKPHALVIFRLTPSLRAVASLGVIAPGKTLARTLVLRAGSYLLATGRPGPHTDRQTLVLLRVKAASSGAKGAPAGSAAPTGTGSEGGAGSSRSDPAAGASTGGGSGDAANGARLFAALGCGACHVFAAAGSTGTVGPNLDVTNPSASRIVAVVKTGSAGMPAFASRVTDQELLDLAAFINSSAGGGGGGGTTGGGTTPAGGGSIPASGGAQVFASAGCGGCHTLAAAGSAGTSGPNLDLLRPSQSRVAAIVTSGGVVMPAYDGRLTAAQIQDVAAYVSSVAGTGAGGIPSGPPGLLLFQRGGCGSCHTLSAAGATGKSGPNLDRERPSAKSVVEALREGPDKMPSYTTTFTAAEMTELGKWIESVTRGG